MTRTGAAARPPVEARAESAFDWAQAHVREVIIGLVLLVGLAGGAWLWSRSRSMKADRAERAYYEAQQALSTGNRPLARTELERVTTRYAGTSAASQATIALAQLLYDEGKYADGVKRLEDAVNRGTARPFRTAIHGLIAAGYEELGKYADAARSYERAAEAAEFDLDRKQMLANAARAYSRAQNTDQARRLWTTLAEDESSPLAGEARVRLGELTAQPAAR